jgi:hypothetical protein
MKIYTREEVVERIKKFQELLAREHTLQEEILSLNLHGDKESFEKNKKRHDEILAELEEIRFKGMLPILEEMGNFVKECRNLEKEKK